MPTKIWQWIAILVVLALIGVALASPSLFKSAQQPVTITDPTALAGLQMGDAPWTTNIDQLHGRLVAIGLPALAAEGTAMHIHQHLDMYVDGKAVDVPAGIGINEGANFISPIHVHDTTGIIHVESPTVETFTLGQFFDVWGVKFTAECIGGYCTDATHSLTLVVNGQPYVGDPRTLALTSHQEIAIVYGTETDTPVTIPTSYVFPAGY
jgi:hypothetical protein